MPERKPSALVASGHPSPSLLFWNYFFQMSTMGVFLPFFSIYARGLGFSYLETSLVTISIPLIQLFSPPLYGWLADLYISRNTLFRFSLILPLLLAPLFYLSRSFSVMFLLILIFGISRSPSSSLLNAAAMEVLKGREEVFGRLRLGGSLGFVLFALLEGIWLELFGSHHFPDLLILGLFLSFLVGMRTPLPQGERLAREEARHTFLRTVRTSYWFLFLLGISLHWGASQSFNLFFSSYLQGLRYPTSYSGLLWGLAILSETIFFYLSSRILRLYPLAFLLQGAAALAVGRWLCTAWFPSPLAQAGIQLSHGITFGLFYAALILWIHKHSPAGLATTFQGLAHGVMFGIGGGVGQLLSGYIFDVQGGAAMFYSSAGLDLLALICFLLLPARKQSGLPVELRAPLATPRSS